METVAKRPIVDREDEIPRCVKPVQGEADASERGYGAVSYIRLVDAEGRKHVLLLRNGQGQACTRKDDDYT